MRETKRSRRHRESGLTFAWQLPEASGWAMAGAVLIASLLAVLLFTSLRVRIVPPPRVIERKAQWVLIPSGQEGLEWRIRAHEAGPFPARFEPLAWSGFQETEDRALADLQTRAARRPQLHDWPVESTAIATPVATKGQRILPKTKWQTPLVVANDAQRPWELKLQRLTALPEHAWPKALPPFEGRLDSATTAGTWRFLVQVASDGRVSQSLMLNASSDPGGQALEQWLRGVRFGAAASEAGWIGVGIEFNRKP